MYAILTLLSAYFVFRLSAGGSTNIEVFLTHPPNNVLVYT